MKIISILGSTGSIGKNSLKVIDNLAPEYKIKYLSANQNVDLLASQAIKYNAYGVVVGDEKFFDKCVSLLSSTKIKVLVGRKGLIEAASDDENDVVINSLVGSFGLEPTIAAAKVGKHIALANKESLVMAGEVVKQICNQTGAFLTPIDSEHSAIAQALLGEDTKNIKRIYLTASGGPFRNRTESFENITVKEALNHPNWNMGSKITIDSATMMNKGFEFIEAVHLFDIAPKTIEIVVHPESVIHSMVQFNDNSIIAQLGVPDMKLPIQFALTYPNRKTLDTEKLDLFKLQSMHFYKPDTDKFPSINLAKYAIEQGGTMPVVLNAVNEIMVYKFLADKIKFPDIYRKVEEELGLHKNIKNPTIEEILSLNDEIWNRLG